MRKFASRRSSLDTPAGFLAVSLNGIFAALLAGCPSSDKAPGNAGGAPDTGAPTGGGADAAVVTTTPPEDAGNPASDAAPAAPLVPGPGILMRGNNLQRHGANLFETILSPATVNGATFGKLACREVDGEIYGQMLYVPNLDFGDRGQRNVLYVVTMRNRVYAFDADDQQEPPLWEKSFIEEPDRTPVPARELGRTCGTYRDISTWVGITSTPAIDPATRTLYFVARGKEGVGPDVRYVQHLHAINMLDGSPQTGSPVVIEARIQGTGAGTVGGMIPFNGRTQNQRSALMIHEGVLYIAWASHCDEGPYHGWVLGYDTRSLSQVVVYNTSPNGNNAGIWMSGAGPAVDDMGFLYFITGNGSADLGAEGGPNRGHSFLKLRREGNTLQLVDWFTPFNYQVLENEDRDLGSAGPVLIPGTSIVMGGGKEGKLYLLDRMNMGKFRSTDDGQIPQTVNLTVASQPPRAHMHGTPVYWKSQEGEFVYVMAEHDYLKQFRVVDGKLQLYKMSAIRAPIDPFAPNTYTMPGGTLAISADGDKPGSAIVWVTINVSADANNAVVPGMVRAFDASDVSRELWSSLANNARDGIGLYAKFNPATVYNGKVYVPSFSNRYCVYGNLNP